MPWWELLGKGQKAAVQLGVPFWKMLQGGPAAAQASTDHEDKSSTLGTMNPGRGGLRKW